MPAYHAARPLRRCLEALAQSLDRPAEVIVVDDGSRDATGEVARAFGCTVVRLATNRGPAAARNAGAVRATQPWLFFLDSDTAVLPSTLGTALRRLAQSGADAVVGRYTPAPLNAGFFPRYYCLLKHWSHRRACDRYNVLASQCAVIRRATFHAVGGYQPFRPGVDIENEELGRRVAAAGRIVLDPAVQVAHEFGGPLRLLRSLARRSFWWTRYFTEHRTFETALTTRRVALATAGGPLGAALLLGACAAPAGWPWLAAGGAAALGVYGYGYGPFLRFAAREAGWWFAARAGIVGLGVSAAVLAGAAAGALSAPFPLPMRRADEAGAMAEAPAAA
ncbi:MAG: glycosyltransferase family 2 protein [Candidatus Omnitrophica bacterium]|nr:glycosyltransferase family 2 protein [Candidatus Omnitrophota bacterium]